MLGFSLRLQSIDTAATYYNFRIVTSNRNYTCFFEPDKWSSDTSLYNTINYSALVDMDANDTAEINGFSSGGTSQTDIIGNSTTAHSIFWGYLVA